MKKVFATILAMLLAGALLAGCNGQAASSNAPSGAASSPAGAEAPGPEPVTITYWYYTDTPEWSASLKKIVEQFNATNGKGITVKAEEYPWDGGGFNETAFTMAMGGAEVDCSKLKLVSTTLFTENNLLHPLNDYIDNWEDRDKISDNLWDVMRAPTNDGNIYTLTQDTQILYVYYRPSMFREVGIEVPQTYEEFLDACAKLTRDTDGDGKTDVYGFGMRGSTNGHEPWGMFIQAAGGSFEDFTTPDAVKGMQDFVDLYQKGYVPPTAPNDGYSEVINNFKSGLTAMVVHHTGSSIDIEEALGDDVAAFQFPAGKGRWTSMGENENVIFANSKHKDAAWEWLKYLSAGEGQEMWCIATGNIPVSKEVSKLDFFQDNRFMKASVDGMDFAGIFPIRSTTSEFISTVWPQTVGSALLGQTSAEEAMKTLQEFLYR